MLSKNYFSSVMRWIAALLILFTAVPPASAMKQGKPLIDSLDAFRRSQNPDDATLLRIYADQVYEYRNIDYGKALELADKAEQLAFKLKDSSTLAYIYLSRSVLYSFIDSTHASIRFAKASYDLARKHNADILPVISIIVATTQLFSDEDQARYVAEAVEALKHCRDPLWRIRGLGQIGNMFRGAREDEKADYYIGTALQEAKDRHYPYEMGINYLRKVWLVKDRVHALRLADSAHTFFEYCQSYRLMIENECNVFLPMLLDSFRETQSTDAANAFLLHSRATQSYIAGFPYPYEELQLDSMIADYYKLRGNTDSAYHYLQQAFRLKSSMDKTRLLVSIQRDDYQKNLSLLETERQFQQAMLRGETQRRNFLIGLCTLFAVIAIIVFRNLRRQKKYAAIIHREQQKNEELLLNILPAEVASDLKKSGSSAARHFDNITVLFTDFVNFTEAGERMSPQELVDELHTCFKAFDQIITRYGIEKIKTIGDAYLAAGGLPAADKDHAVHVVKAAIDIHRFMEQRHREKGNSSFNIRLGIHSGPVVAGIVGVKKFAYDIWGDTVNTAARMEQHSEAGRINISQSTYELVEDQIPCTYRGEIAAKNKGVMKMYFVNTATI
ncbi:MAG: adenylate/guanylate cyclase domain-containing protein [Sphingobacteriales bacterium]|nr:MAG: adenylate/guanylate cyclase domain-containing protein [Sphingobacteriales bacterium]